MATEKANGNNGNNKEKFKFKVRNETYEVDKPVITGREVCEIAGLVPPEQFKLDLKKQGNEYREIALNDTVDLTEPGIEKFVYIARDQSEG